MFRPTERRNNLKENQMAGSVLGGKAAAKTNKEKYGADFYQKIGALGGKKGKTGGFASPLLCDCDYKEESHKKASCAGALGGTISRRGKGVR